LEPVYRQPRVCDEPIGHGAAPTFFWDGKGRQGNGSFIVDCLIHMGVWRDSSQPQFEETGAVRHVARI